MSIVDLILKAGLQNVRVQPLHASLIKMHRKKRDTELTFATTHANGASVAKEASGIRGTHVGLVVWIPRENIEEKPELPISP
jgi:hypothetical protein